MKCTRCGYFNLPGSDTCGRCGNSLAAADGCGRNGVRQVAFEEIYPPRARNRAPFAELSAKLRRRTAPARRGVATAASAIVIPEWQAWTAASFAVIPGVVQAFQGRIRQAVFMLTALTILVVAFVALLHQPFADVFLWLLAALSVYSVWEAADIGFAAPGNVDAKNAVRAQRLRALRLLLLAVTIVAATVVTLFGVCARWYSVSTIQTDQSAPALRIGDVVVAHALTASSIGSLHRGDVILYNLAASLPQGVEMQGSGSGVERIIGLPGDVVEAQGSTIKVNGLALAATRLPLTAEAAPSTVRVTVPAGVVCVWQGFTIMARNGIEAPPTQPYLLISRDQVEAAVIAICEPPTRRRWFR